MSEQWLSPPNRGTATYSNGNKTFVVTGTGGQIDAYFLAAESKSGGAGRFYVETIYDANTPGNDSGVWISETAPVNGDLTTLNFFFYCVTGALYTTNWPIIDTLAGYTIGDVIGTELDFDNDRIRFYKNGIQQGSDLPWTFSTGYYGVSAELGDGATLYTGPTFAHKPSGTTDWYVAGGGGYSLASDAGAYATTGTAAALKIGRKVAANGAAIALNGTAAGVRVVRRVVGGPGSLALVGTPAALERGRIVGGTAAAFALSGTAATLRKGYPVVGSGGAYATTGVDAGLRLARETTALSGSLALSGLAAGLEYGRKVAGDAGSYAVSGAAAQLELVRRLGANGASYAVTGTDAALVYSGSSMSYALSADAGGFNVAGADAGLTYTPIETARYASAGGTTWTRKTVSRLAREAERARKAKKPRPAETIVAEAVATIFGGSIAVQQAVQQAIAEVPLAPAAPITTDIMARLIRQAQLILEQQDEEDAILLLMAA